jgi:sugar phosphate isomerase/epimerase
MFKIGFRSYATKEDLEMTKRIGMEVIELMWEERAWNTKDEIKSLLKHYDIKVSAMTMGAHRNFEEFKGDIDYAMEIGCPVLVGHPNPLTPNDKVAIEDFKNVWTPSCKYAADKGVWMSVHSCGLGPVSWEIMMNEVPGLGIKYDPSFSEQAGRNIRAEMVKFGKYFSHVHAKDEMFIERTTDFNMGQMIYRYAPAGMGDIHWGSVIGLLYEMEYKGDIAIEPHSHYWGWSSMERLERGLVIAKRHLEQFIA